MLTSEQAKAVRRLCHEHPNHRLFKYRHWRAECQVAAYHCTVLGITDAPPCLRVLDLGGGLSYFAAECNRRGHEATTLDLLDDFPQQVADALGVLYVPWMIVAYNRLPVSGPFDLITAMRLNMTEPDRWGWPEFEWFANHLLNLLTPGGRWYMNPNRGENVAFILDAAEWVRILGDRASVSHPTPHSIVIRKAGPCV